MTLTRCFCDLQLPLTWSEACSETVTAVVNVYRSQCGALQRWEFFCPHEVIASTAPFKNTKKVQLTRFVQTLVKTYTHEVHLLCLEAGCGYAHFGKRSWGSESQSHRGKPDDSNCANQTLKLQLLSLMVYPLFNAEWRRLYGVCMGVFYEKCAVRNAFQCSMVKTACCTDWLWKSYEILFSDGRLFYWAIQ